MSEAPFPFEKQNTSRPYAFPWLVLTILLTTMPHMSTSPMVLFLRKKYEYKWLSPLCYPHSNYLPISKFTFILRCLHELSYFANTKIILSGEPPYNLVVHNFPNINSNEIIIWSLRSLLVVFESTTHVAKKWQSSPLLPLQTTIHVKPCIRFLKYNCLHNLYNSYNECKSILSHGFLLVNIYFKIF